MIISRPINIIKCWTLLIWCQRLILINNPCLTMIFRKSKGDCKSSSMTKKEVKVLYLRIGRPLIQTSDIKTSKIVVSRNFLKTEYQILNWRNKAYIIIKLRPNLLKGKFCRKNWNLKVIKMALVRISGEIF